jgi:GDP-4-dehydro-6-deoxy-D-mannose reductase
MASRGPVLVTGAAGFVGSHLLELLAADASPVVAWRRPGTTPLVEGAAVWMSVEMLEAAAVESALADVRPAAIYHLAGAAHVAESWSHTRETFEGNVRATHHLLRGLARLDLRPRVLVAGSATVYKPSEDALTEESALAPASPYATSKLAQEMLARQAGEEDGIPVLLARAFNHVGPRQTPAFVAPSIARQIAEIEAGLRPAVLQMGNLEARRDVMDVRDTVRAYRAMISSARPGVPYNVCGGRAVRIGDLVDVLRARARCAIAIEHDPTRLRPNDVPVLYGSHARLTRDTGWTPGIPLEQTLDDLLEYWRASALPA